MPNYRRARVEDGTDFFTVNTFRQQLFLTDAAVRAVQQVARMKSGELCSPIPFPSIRATPLHTETCSRCET